MKSIAILGATGSIGRSALAVVDAHPDRLRVVALGAGANAARLADQYKRYRPSLVALASDGAGREFAAALDGERPPEIACGPDALLRVATHPEADIVLIAIVGTAGLQPALAAIRAGKDIAVASKEILVMAGEIVMSEARKHGVKVLRTPPEILVAYLKAWDGFVEEESGKNPVFKKILDSEKAWASIVVPAKRFMHPPYSFAANYYWPEGKAGAAPAASRSACR